MQISRSKATTMLIFLCSLWLAFLEVFLDRFISWSMQTSQRYENTTWKRSTWRLLKLESLRSVGLQSSSLLLLSLIINAKDLLLVSIQLLKTRSFDIHVQFKEIKILLQLYWWHQRVTQFTSFCKAFKKVQDLMCMLQSHSLSSGSSFVLLNMELHFQLACSSLDFWLELLLVNSSGCFYLKLEHWAIIKCLKQSMSMRQLVE